MLRDSIVECMFAQVVLYCVCLSNKQLTLSLNQSYFSAVSWSHPDLGEPVKIELEEDDNDELSTPTSSVELHALSSDIHQYSFAPTGPREFIIDQSNVLPTLFTLSGGAGARVKAVRVTRYGRTISGLDFADPDANLWDCINVCSAFADSTSLWLGPDYAEEVFLDFINAIECRKVVIVYAADRVTGRELCTSPVVNVESIADLKGQLAVLLNPAQPYRTLLVNITSDLNEIDSVVSIQTNRGLDMFVDTDIVDESVISGTAFSVSSLGELYFDGFDLNGSTKLVIASEGLAEISGGTLSSLTADPPFVTNSGSTTFTSVKVLNSTRLSNDNGGFLSLTYVEFLDESSLKNSLEGTL
jgi:hypothetical protein